MRVTAGAPASPWRRFVAPWALGTAGVASLLLVPPAAPVVASAPAWAAASPLGLRVLPALGPWLLVTLAALAGAAWAHRVGLRSVLAGTAGPTSGRAFAATLGRAAFTGVLLGAALVTIDAALVRATPPWWPAARLDAAPAWPMLAVGVLYGGLAEEILVRWGLMAALTMALTRAFARLAPPWRPPGVAVVGIAVVLTSLAFAAAHLPALAALATPAPGTVARTMALNTLGGAAYAALAWRRGLEAAMAAHAATHVGRFAAQGLAL